ncbi:ATP-binding cassette domain-containing protein [candidate division KSB1 bacterium]|nr:ATP-binding cassette domain-containing protein [candidate division KSB1 bacterium]
MKIIQIKTVFHYLSNYKKLLSIGSFSVLLSILLYLPQPLLTKYTIDNIIVNKKLQTLPSVIAIIFFLMLLQIIFSFMKKYYFLLLEQKVIFDIKHDLFNKVLHFPKSFFDCNQTGYLMTRLGGDVHHLRTFFSKTIVDLFANLLKFVGAIIILMYLNFTLTWIVLITIPFFFCAVLIFGKKMKMLSHIAMEKSALLSRNLQESISNIHLVKEFAQEERQTEKYGLAMKENIDAGIKHNIFNTCTNLIVGFIAAIGALFVLWFGAREIILGRLTLGSFIAFNAYIGYLYGPSMFFANTFITVQNSLAALERVFELFELSTEDDAEALKPKIQALHGHIQLKSIYFSYTPKGFMLKDISFSALPGEQIAIVGPTGAGKTTLLNLILLYYKPSTGSIYFDGKNANNLNIHSLRERIGVVSQEIFLWNDSILNNICFGNPKATKNEIIYACKLAQANEFIEKSPEGLNSIVGERGLKLSIGQKQRISIARALLKNPDILIFDEPTSALDSLTEKAIKNNIFDKKHGKTTLIIAHRLSTVCRADTILVMEEGKIVERGNHDELFKINGLYASMFREQMQKKSVFSTV